MIKLLILCVLPAFLLVPSAAAQNPAEDRPAESRFVPTIGAIHVELISTSAKGLSPLSMDEIRQTWKDKNIGLALESTLDVNAIEKAKESLQDAYQAKGRSVRVESRIQQMPNRHAAEVQFRVIELCSCDH